jgi:hypothetical protein
VPNADRDVNRGANEQGKAFTSTFIDELLIGLRCAYAAIAVAGEFVDAHDTRGKAADGNNSLPYCKVGNNSQAASSGAVAPVVSK